MSNLQLITRADDAGSCCSANEAILECVEAGIIKNVSFLAVGPEIEHAVEILGGRDDIAYGFHVCFNAEWEDVKWGPLRPSQILTDKDGYFLPFPKDTKAQIEREAGFNDVKIEIMFEVAAQLEKLRELGLPISYLDEHIGVSWIGFRDELAMFSQSEKLVDHYIYPSLPSTDVQGDELSRLEASFSECKSEKCVWITHPGKDESDMQEFNLIGQQKGIVAKERDAERRLITDARLPELFKKWKVKPVRYDEI